MFKGGRRLPRIKYCGDTEDNLWQASEKKREKRTVALSFLPGQRRKPAEPRVHLSPAPQPYGGAVMHDHMWHPCPTGVFFFFFKFSRFNFPPSSRDRLDLQSNKDDSVWLEDGCADSFHTWMREDSQPDEQRGRYLCFRNNVFTHWAFLKNWNSFFFLS